MDPVGNFTIVWQETGQPLSFFNDILAQQYNSDGNPVGGNFRVNTEDTNIHFDPHVAIDNQGDIGITWSMTSNPNYLKGLPAAAIVMYKIIAANGNVLVPETPVPNSAGGSTIAFDSNDNFAISWDELATNDNTGTVAFGDVYAAEWQLYQRDAKNNIVLGANGTPVVLDTQVRSPFRVSSANFNPSAKTTWPNGQGAAQIALDADGDITVGYEGFGPDVSVNVSLAPYYFAQILNESQNADIRKYFEDNSGNFTNLPTSGLIDKHPVPLIGYESFQGTATYGGNGSVDGVLNSLMLYAYHKGATASQLGRIYQIANDVAGMLRGEADGVMYSQFDSSPAALVPGAVPTILYSDSIANNTRDGSDEVDFLDISGLATSGSFVLQLTNGANNVVASTTITLPASTDPNFVYDLAAEIQTSLDALPNVGINWPLAGLSNGITAPSSQPALEGPVDVRLVSKAEIDARNGIASTTAKTSLSSAVTDATSTSITVVSAAGFPTGSLPFNVIVDSEVMRVIAVSGTTWTVNRGVGGSTAVAHPGGAPVTLLAATPWAVTAADTDLVYEITFQGEVHDTPMKLAVTSSTLKEAPQPCLQQVTLKGVPVSGTTTYSYNITFNGQTYPGLAYDPTDPTGVADFAGAIAAWLNAPTAQGGAGVPAATSGTPLTVTVGAVSEANGTFVLVFPAGAVEPPITIVATPVTVQGQPAPTWSAVIKIIQQAGTPDAPAPIPLVEVAGNAGTPQVNSSIAMSPSGNYVMAWEQMNDQGGTYNTNVYYRQFNESTTTAGPMSSSFELADTTAPGGIVRIQSSAQAITSANLGYIIVTFDENMMTTGSSSVTDPQNWSLLENGVQLLGGIQQIYFGLNEAAMLSQYSQYASLGLPTTSSNKFEAVLILNGTGAFNPATGLQSLAAGNYTITALNSLRDLAGNPLGRTGYTPQGYGISRTFDVLTPTGGQSQVNDPAAVPATTDVQSPETIATDANGDAVVVWTSETKTQLVSAVNATAGTIYVAAATSFPATPFNIYVDGEEMTVTGVDYSGLVWTVKRGINGTTKAHAANAVVMLAGGNTAGVYAEMYQATWKTSLVAMPNSTTITVVSAAGFPTGGGPFNILVDAEVMTVTNVSGTTWTVTRGVNGTTAAVHSSGAIVFLENGRVTALTPSANGQITVASDSTGQTQYEYASVAQSADGDFVVTWSELGPTTSSWDVYAQWYTATGHAADVQRNEPAGDQPGGLPGQHDRGQRPAVFDGLDGQPGRRRNCLAEPRPGRQRLRRLLATVQSGRRPGGRHGSGRIAHVCEQSVGHVHLGMEGLADRPDQLRGQRRQREYVRDHQQDPKRTGQPWADGPGDGNLGHGDSHHVHRTGRGPADRADLFGQHEPQFHQRRQREHYAGGHGEGGHGGNAGQHHDRGQPDVPRRLHGPERDVRRHVDVFGRGGRRHRE